MKKSGFIIVLVVLLIQLSYVYAAQDNDTIIQNSQNISQFQEKVNQFFSGETIIKVPEEWQVLARILFGIIGDIPAKVFIILIVIWIILFLLLTEIIGFMPILNKGFSKFIGAFIVTWLIALSGTIRSIAVFFLNLGNIFGILEKKGTVITFLIAVIILGILSYGLDQIIKIVRKDMDIEKAASKGRKIAAMNAKAEAISEIDDKI
jgi:hypothetical protein